MPALLPFRGLLPTPEHAPEVAAVPYDVVSTQEAAALAAGHPLSFLHVSRPEIDLEPGAETYTERMYAQAAAAFQRIRRDAPLLQDSEKHLYVYRLRMNGHVQTGVFGAASVTEYNENVIRKHETTRKDKEDDRAKHIMALRAHTGPAFFTYRDNARIDMAVSAETDRKPLFDFTAADGIRHTLWRVPAENSMKLASEFRNVDHFYIADGHHRSAAAARAAAECAGIGGSHAVNEECSLFLAAAFPASQLAIFPYNRVIRTLNGADPRTFLKSLEKNFSLSSACDGFPAHRGEIRMFLEGSWHMLTPKFDAAGLGPVEQLDVSILQTYVLAPLLNIADPRTSGSIDFIGGADSVASVERKVTGGDFAVGFSLYHLTVDDLMRISDSGAIMPPKSTWFEPKLRDGLVCHVF